MKKLFSSQKRAETSRLRQFNNFLSFIVIILAIYISVGPFLPNILWWLQRDAPVISTPAPLPPVNEPIPEGRSLYIPSLELRENIIEGTVTSTVDQGVWRRPQTSQPDKGGNTVLVGHRFTYRGQSVFYHLDKVKVQDKIILYWDNKKYTYLVDNIREVSAREVSVEDPTPDSQLTIYTCTPLITAQNRLVIKAELEDIRQ